MRLVICFKKPKDIDKVRANHRVSADTDTSGLPNAELLELERRLVSQRAASGDNADIARTIGERRHHADLAFVRGNNARTVRADETRRSVWNDGGIDIAHPLQKRFRAHHIQNRDVFGYTDDLVDTSSGGFHHRIGGESRRNENHGGIRTGCFNAFRDGIKNRDAVDIGAASARHSTGDNLGAVSGALLGMKTSGTASNALDDDFCVFVNKYAHIFRLDEPGMRAFKRAYREFQMLINTPARKLPSPLQLNRRRCSSPRHRVAQVGCIGR